MKKLLLVTFVALLMVGCGEPAGIEEEQKRQEELFRIRAEEAEEAKQWAEWEANPKPYGGAYTLSQMRRVKGEGIKNLTITCTSITDVSPLAGLKHLKKLKLIVTNPIPDDQKAILRKALPNCDISFED